MMGRTRLSRSRRSRRIRQRPKPVAYNRGEFQPINIYKTATSVDASQIRQLARNFEALADELVVGIEQAHATAVKVVYDQALTNASSESAQASKAARSPQVFYTQVKKSVSFIYLHGGTNFSAGDKHSPLNFSIGSEFGAKQDVQRRLVPRLNRGFGRVKNPKSNQYADLPREIPERDSMLGWNQFQPWRGNRNVTGEDGQMPGYWLWPAVRGTRDEVVNAFGTQAMKTVQEALNN